MRRGTCLAALVMGLLIGLGGTARALDIVFEDMGGAEEGTVARRAYEEAARFWEALIEDDVTVRLGIGLGDYGETWLGASWVGFYYPHAPAPGWEWGGPISPTYTEVKAALMADRKSNADYLACSNLPSGDYTKWRVNTYDDVGHTLFSPDPADVTTMTDANTTGNNTRIVTPLATAKALGMLADDGVSWDGYIFLNSYYGFDYDRSDGIGSPSGDVFDFVGIVIHEMGHQLGFVSGVDTIDYSLFGGYEGFGPGFTVNDLNDGTPWGIYMPLDLYRLSAEAMAAGADVRDGAAGGDPYFSIDRGVTNLGGFEIGGFYGGWQASHWRSPDTFDPSLVLGLMNPWVDWNMLVPFADRDLLALDVIGWDVVPEPGTFVLFGVAALGLAIRRRRRAA
jgi:hypothetical protein